MSGPAPTPHCIAGAPCITCGDQAVAMRLVAPGAGGLALCADEHGGRELVDTTLVSPVATGDRVLVHAGVALVRLAGGAA